MPRYASFASTIAALASAVLATLSALMVPATAFAQNTTSDYRALVRAGLFDGYREAYVPGTSGAPSDGSGNVVLITSHGSLTNSLIKIFVPPGARMLGVSYQSYAVPEPALAAARFRQVPTSSASSITLQTEVDYTATLQRLIAGEELTFYGPPSSGGAAISYPNTASTFKSTTGGYIYFNLFAIPGGSLISLQTQLYVDQACYSSWYAAATFDASGMPSETATHTCSGSSGGGSTPPGGGASSIFSPSQLTVGSTTSATIAPTSAGAVRVCTASSPYVALNSSGVFLTPSAVQITSALDVAITCDGQSHTLRINPAAGGGASGGVLTGISFSSSTLTAATGASVTLIAQPQGASLASCYALLPAFVTLEGSTVRINAAGEALTSARTQRIECNNGAVGADLAISPGASLGAITLSKASIAAGTDEKVELLPQPASASLGTCVAKEPALVTITGTSVQLNASGHDLTSAQTQVIECGPDTQKRQVQLQVLPRPAFAGVTGILTTELALRPDGYLPLVFAPYPAVAESCAPVGSAGLVQVRMVARRGTKFDVAEVTPTQAGLAAGQRIDQVIECVGANTRAQVTIRLVPSGGTLAPVERIAPNGALGLTTRLYLPHAALQSKVDVWISARVPPHASLGNTRDLYLLLGPNGWDTLRTAGEAARNALAFKLDAQPTESVDPNPFASGAKAAVVEIAPELGVPKSLLTQYAIELHLAYRIDEGPIVNMGAFYSAP